MSEQMEFPITFEEFAKEYGFNDHRHIYTNGSDLIPIFRVKQWIEHDNKLRKIETDTAYECGKHANKWISVIDISVIEDIKEELESLYENGIYPPDDTFFREVIDEDYFFGLKYAIKIIDKHIGKE